jgi:hypothetical protein
MSKTKFTPLVDKQNIEHNIHGKCMCEACNCGK